MYFDMGFVFHKTNIYWSRDLRLQLERSLMNERESLVLERRCPQEVNQEFLGDPSSPSEEKICKS